MFVTVYQTNPDISTSYYRIQHKSRPAFLPNGFAIPFISQPTTHPEYPPSAAEIRFIEMPRHGNVQHDFYRIALLPLEIDLSHSDFPLLPASRTDAQDRLCRLSDRPQARNLHFFTPHARSSHTTEIPAAPTIGRKPYEETSVISAAPSETIMCVREPAPFMRVCRSTPISRPQTAATIRRTRQII